MSFGKNDSSGLKTHFFKINGLKKGSDPKELYFKGQHYVEDKLVDMEDQPTFIEGYLKEITTDEYEYEGNKINTFKMVLEDADGRYILESSFSNLAVSILNTLSGTKDIGKVNLSLYTSKKGYPSVFITIDDDDKKGKWKWEYKELAAMKEEVKDKKGKVVSIDKSELEDFLIKHLNSDAFKKQIVGVPSVIPEAKKEEVDPFIEQDDDVPF